MLQIIEGADGKITTKIIRTKEPEESTLQLSADLHAIQQAALNIINLQEIAKKNGELGKEEREVYEKNLEQLNTSAKNLADMQQKRTDDDIGHISRINLQSWFETKKEKFGYKQSHESTDEENVGEQTEEATDGGGDGVEVNLPPDDASIAEAKPVGLAVAGIGGVAASKPIATAVVGPQGLAIARPVATAIAGVSPDEALIPISEDGYLKFPQRKKDKKKDKDTDEKNEKEEKSDDFLRNYRIRFYN